MKICPFTMNSLREGCAGDKCIIYDEENGKCYLVIIGEVANAYYEQLKEYEDFTDEGD